MKSLLGAALLFAVFSPSCLKNSSSGSSSPTPPPQPPAKEFLNPLNLSITIDPLKKTAGLQSRPGADAVAVGTIAASLSGYKNMETGYLFHDDLAIVFLELKGAEVKDDVFDIRLQLTGLGSDSVTAKDVMPVIPGLEDLQGQILISGADEQGLPYYKFGDFYGTDRSKALGWDTSSWTNFLAFDLHGHSQTFTVTGQVFNRVLKPNNAEADITIAPFLSAMTANSVAIIWETDCESGSFVYYGKSRPLPVSAAGDVSRYQSNTYSLIRKPPVFDLFKHRVFLTGLEPGTTYYYQVRDLKDPTPIYSFRTLDSQPKASFKFAVYGDTQDDQAVHVNLINEMARHEFEFAVHLGDLADSFIPPGNRQIFFQIERPVISLFPIFQVRGNHDDFVFYKEYFEFPPAGAGASLDKHCYSFRYQGVYFVVIDNNIAIDPASEQYDWLKRTLTAASADPERKFTFIFAHMPMYSGYSYFTGMEILSAIAPLFRAYNVSAAFSGHIHLYERVEFSGKPYITFGGGGGSYYAPGDPPDQALMAEESTVSGDTVVDKFHDWRRGFLIVEVGQDSFSISAFDNAGKLFDSAGYHK